MDPLLELVTELGDALNRSSYPTPQARDVLVDISHSYNEDITVEVFPTLVFGLNRKNRELSVAQTGSAFRFDQMVKTQNLIQKLKKATIKPPVALAELREISASPAPWPAWIRVLGYALQALGFAQLLRMGLAATLFSTALGIVVGTLMLWSSVKGTLAALMPVLMTFVSALIIGIAATAGDSADPVRTAAVPVLILIPGAALTCALIELTGGDMIAGASRLIYACFILISMAFGFAVAVSLAQVPADTLQDLPTSQSPWYWAWLAVPIFSIGNIMYFCTPKKLWFFIVVVALSTYSVFQLLQLILEPAFASGLAAGFALILAMALNRESRAGPSTLVLFLPAFWLLVPGSMGFVAISGVIIDNPSLSDLGTQAVLSLMSIAVGIMMASMAAPYFSSNRKKLRLTPHPHRGNRQPPSKAR